MKAFNEGVEKRLQFSAM